MKQRHTAKRVWQRLEGELDAASHGQCPASTRSDASIELGARLRAAGPGPTVDRVRFSGMPEIGAFVVGRGWYALVMLVPMVIAAAYGAAHGYGDPPYADVIATQNVALHYSSLLMPPPRMSLPGPEGLGASEYNLGGKRNAVAGLIDTYAIMYPQLQQLDFRRDVVRLDVPVFVVQGQDEALGREDLTREWFASSSAPSKQLFSRAEADRMPNCQAPEAFADVIARVLAETGLEPTFGFIRAIDLDTGSVDRALWLRGRVGADAAVADGEAPVGTADMPNGFYLRNTDPRTVTVSFGRRGHRHDLTAVRPERHRAEHHRPRDLRRLVDRHGTE